MKERNQFIIPASVLAAAIIIFAIILAVTWRGNSKLNQTITVTGSAKRGIVSDLGFLRGMISVQSSSAADAYNDLQSQKPVLLQYLEGKGFPNDKVNFFTMTSYPIYEVAASGIQTNRITGYHFDQRFEISSGDVNKIKSISLEISSLASKGINLLIDMPEYHYTKLGDLKKVIQAEAALDAKDRADKIVAATGRKLGDLKSARLGVLQITPKFSNIVSDYGINDLSSIDKEITAVISASFQIE